MPSHSSSRVVPTIPAVRKAPHSADTLANLTVESENNIAVGTDRIALSESQLASATADTLDTSM